MSPFQSLVLKLSAALVLGAGLAACSGEAPAPLVWQARHVVVMPIDGGRQVQALWVRNGISLMARYRSAERIGEDDLLLDVARQLVWLRDGTTLKALTMPELELFATQALPAEALVPALSLAEDGAVRIGDGRFSLADGLAGQAPAQPLRYVERLRPRG